MMKIHSGIFASYVTAYGVVTVEKNWVLSIITFLALFHWNSEKKIKFQKNSNKICVLDSWFSLETQRLSKTSGNISKTKHIF